MAQQPNKAVSRKQYADKLWALNDGLTDLIAWPGWPEWPHGIETKAKLEQRLAETNTKLYSLGEI